MPVFIYEPEALSKMGQVEGGRWLKEQQGAKPTGYNFATYKGAWDLMSGEPWPCNVDPNLVSMGEELGRKADGAIYGEGGYARYIVRFNGEIVLLKWSTREEKHRLAEQIGFAVV